MCTGAVVLSVPPALVDTTDEGQDMFHLIHAELTRTVAHEHDVQRARVVRSLLLRPDGDTPRHRRI
jgi:hypothetical protein